ncbi:MAG: YegS/Rv2252/BmrU family lipid kinase [Clostridia bacterium]|jgi:diacylglycerol kinase (ATP)|nr:YegS/Rv2252/BmrU family lipid kinase [Clostridia bacterium]
MKKALFVYNPNSGGSRILQRLDLILKTAQENDVCLFPYRIAKNSNDKFLATLELNNFDYVIISGGDGTLNTTVNFLLKNNYNMPIGVIPAGTCNDFANSLRIPNKLVDCLNTIFTGKTLDVDLGIINDELYFLNTCAGGLFVDVSFNTQDELKRNFGPLAYYLKALGEVAHKKPFPLKITTETECINVKGLLFCILNGTQGGGFTNLIKDADISDGLMDMVIIKNCYHIDLASLFFRALSQESLNTKHALRLKAKECFIEGPDDVILSVDGEKGPSLPVKIKFLQKKIKVFVP